MFHISKDFFPREKFASYSLLFYKRFDHNANSKMANFDHNADSKIVESDLLEIMSYLILNTMIHRSFSQLIMLTHSGNGSRKVCEKLGVLKIDYI